MAIFGDPTFWTLVAFLLCSVIFGIKGFFLIKAYLENHIVQIESHLEEAQNLSEDAEALFHKRTLESNDLQQTLKKIKATSDEELKFLSEQTSRKVEDLLKRSETRFQKRLKLMEEQSLIKIREGIANLVYEGSLNILKKQQDKKSQHFFIQEGLESLPKDIQRNT
ncbi:MAG: hypothetical protein B7Y25_03515 [Alphaproteobacteria bacterium 16-39-46]|nr:MAG: hypothetical protein B7Y25_03515 [Alphaproteobacteria bacterium 16-39-46]OZA43229.1 MAG: hypothetical protein B7X84_03740 [Alphaproteobacteria bacterium 17-39-52]